MTQSLVITIEGDFVTLNPYIDAERTHRQKAAQIKKAETERVNWIANGAPPVERYPVDITYIWYWKDKRTDPSNISFCQKYIEDGLQAAGVLRNDGWNEIASIHHLFYIDPQRPRVEVIIEAVE